MRDKMRGKKEQTINTRAYYPYFDYVRFIAASVVMLGHGGLLEIPHVGTVAVDVFFALSGWLIGGILLKIDRKDLPKFYFNRAIRIWIPYFIALLLIVLVSLMKDDITTKWFEFVFYKISFVYNMFGPPQLAEFSQLMPLQGTGNHFWSVNAEEQFYLFAPLLLVVIGKFGRSPVLWLALVLLTWPFNIYSPIFLGVLFAILVHRYGNFHEKPLFRIACVFFIIVGIAGFASELSYRIFSPLFSISIILLLAVTGKPTPFGKFIGGISYPLYLNHWIGVFAAHFLMERIGMRGSLPDLWLAVLINYVAISILYIIVDRPTIAARPRLFTPARGKIAIYIAYSTFAIGTCVGLVLTGS